MSGRIAGIVEAQPKGGQFAGPHILHEDVGSDGEIADNSEIRLGPKIEDDAPLVAIEGNKRRARGPQHGRHVPRIVTPVRPLDLDHIGALLSEDQCRECTRDVRREIEDDQAGEGTVRTGSHLSFIRVIHSCGPLVTSRPD